MAKVKKSPKVLLRYHGWTVTTAAGVTLHDSHGSCVGRAFFMSRRLARKWRRELQPHLNCQLKVERVTVEMRVQRVK